MTDRAPSSAAACRGLFSNELAAGRDAKRRTLSAFLSLLTTLLFATHARADSISLVSGKTIEGKVSFDAKDGLLVLPKGQPSQRIEVKDVLSLQVDAGAPPKPPRRMVTLVSGAQIAGSELLMLNDTELRLKRPDNTIFATNAAAVSSIDFRPDRPFKLPPGDVTGVVVGEGDVSEGEVVSVTDANPSGKNDDEKAGAVKLSSVLFGLQSFNVSKDVRAVLLRPVGVSKASFIVNTADGSVLHAATLRVDRGKLVIQTDLAVEMQLSGDQVRSIELGPASADALSTLATTSADGSLPLPATGSTDIALGSRYRAMVLTLAVPGDYVPSRAMTFVVLADGKEIARAGPLTSVDPPASITRPTDGVTTLTIRTEATAPEGLGIAGAVRAGRFIRKP